MKFKIKEYVEIEKEIELEIPYYFKCIREDFYIHGVVLEDKVVTISDYSDEDGLHFTLDVEFDIEGELQHIIKWKKSDWEEFNAAQNRMKDHLV